MEEVDITKMKVLLVEDDDVSNFLAIYALNEMGIENIDVVENGSLAFSYVKKRCPDVIFLDLNMPVVNGFEFLDLIKKKYPCFKAHVIILSSSMRLADKESCFKHPCVIEYLEKPLDKQKVGQVLAMLQQNN